MRKFVNVMYLSFLLLVWRPTIVVAFLPCLSLECVSQRKLVNTQLFMSSTKQPTKKQKKSTVVGEDLDKESPLQPVGTKFFGGSAEKEELFDANIEKNADQMLLAKIAQSDPTRLSYSRFDDVSAFPDDLARNVAMKLQAQINGILYEDTEVDIVAGLKVGSLYSSSNFEWITPLSKRNCIPLDEIQNALEYYRRLDISVISAKSINSNVVELRWMISVVWPNSWEARVVLTGTSTLTMNILDMSIVKQVDYLDNGGEKGSDVLNAVSWQLFPRFWDVFHVGMTPSAELLQRLPAPSGKKKGLLSTYQVFEVAPRVVARPFLIDTGGRAVRAAQALPTHAFSCVIKTAGPSKQRYVPTTPLEVRIKSEEQSDGERARRITWTVAVPAEVASALSLPLPVEESDPKMASTSYEFQGKRRVATLPYAGYAQDEDVVELRKRLFDSVVKDGFRPKLDDDGKPSFFFLQNAVKCCFTEGGLGMAVYEWRPSFMNRNEVGIELEND